AQHNAGVQAAFGVAPAGNDTVHAHVLTGRALFYGSAINLTGDPSFVPGIATREDVTLTFKGIDSDENGTVDIADANGDGTLDAPVDVFTSLFGNYFRVVAESEFGSAVTYEVISAPSVEAALLDNNGTLRVLASGNVKGTAGVIQIRATSGTSSSVFVIPVRYR
ncbi:MAG TPA: hypothetical protein VF911_03570, partial [Thermoanaerobaculia bacterium]